MEQERIQVGRRCTLEVGAHSAVDGDNNKIAAGTETRSVVSLWRMADVVESFHMVAYHMGHNMSMGRAREG